MAGLAGSDRSVSPRPLDHALAFAVLLAAVLEIGRAHV